MKDEDPERLDVAEILRKKYRYRQLIFSGKLELPHKRAAELLGPDCMYQLYSLQGRKHGNEKETSTKSPPSRRRARRG